MCHVNATLKCVLLFETWFVVIASSPSSSFSQLLFLGCQPGCYRLLNLFTLEITNLKCGRDKVLNTKYTIHIELINYNHIIYYILNVDTTPNRRRWLNRIFYFSKLVLQSLCRDLATNYYDEIWQDQQPCLSA